MISRAICCVLLLQLLAVCYANNFGRSYAFNRQIGTGTFKQTSRENFKKLATANNQFALSLYRELSAQSPRNIIFSPFSISTSFAMLFYGARRQTAAELGNVLGFRKIGMPDAAVHETFGRFLAEVIKSPDNPYVLDSANGILIDKNLTLTKEFKYGVENLYRASVGSVDFLNNGQRIVNVVNDWVRTQTRCKIDNILDALPPDTLMILLNAIYFKGDWEIKFQPEKTDLQLFFNNGLEQNARKVPMMHMISRFLYSSGHGVQALDLSYKGNGLSMFIILPDRKDGLEEFEKSFTLDKFDDLRNRLFTNEVDVSLPKFKMEYSEELSGKLYKLGLKCAFQNGSDFSGITPDRRLLVNQVVHKAVLEVNEEGSEAAAVTSVVLTRQSAMPRAEFNADHPFLFFIVEEKERSDMILFMGRVNSL